MLTDLQIRVRRIVAQLPESARFALAGGAALVVSGVIDRPTNDLDFFAPYPDRVGELADAAQAALEAAGLEVTRLADEQTFARLQVRSAGDTTLLDLASDYRLQAPLATEEGLVLTEEELAADKVLALVGRIGPRDFVDVDRLSSRFDVAVLCELASSKDGGFRSEHFVAALGCFDQIKPSAFDAYTDDYILLRQRLAALRRALEVPIKDGPSADLGL